MVDSGATCFIGYILAAGVNAHIITTWHRELVVAIGPVSAVGPVVRMPCMPLIIICPIGPSAAALAVRIIVRRKPLNCPIASGKRQLMRCAVIVQSAGHLYSGLLIGG